MTRSNLFETVGVRVVISPAMRLQIADFAVDQRQYVLSEDKHLDAFRNRFTGHGPVSDLFQRIAQARLDTGFALMRIPARTVAIPEVMDLSFIPFDLKQIKDCTPGFPTAIAHTASLDDKLLINISDIANANGDFSDITQFQWRVIRDYLSRNYYTNQDKIWLSANIVRYVAKVYSITVSLRLARTFGLSPMVQSFVQLVFALFYIGKMSAVETAPDFVRAHAKQLDFYDLQVVAQTLGFIEDTLDKPAPDSLEDVFAVIAAYGNSQMTKGRLNRVTLYAKVSSLYSDGHLATIAMEYPPYFVYMLLLALSGARIGLALQLKTMQRLMTEGREIADQLVKLPVHL